MKTLAFLFWGRNMPKLGWQFPLDDLMCGFDFIVTCDFQDQCFPTLMSLWTRSSCWINVFCNENMKSHNLNFGGLYISPRLPLWCGDNNRRSTPAKDKAQHHPKNRAWHSLNLQKFSSKWVCVYGEDPPCLWHDWGGGWEGRVVMMRRGGTLQWAAVNRSDINVE